MKSNLKYSVIANKKTNLLSDKGNGSSKIVHYATHITSIKILNIEEKSCHIPSLSFTTVIWFKKSWPKDIQNYLKLQNNKNSENNVIMLNSMRWWKVKFYKKKSLANSKKKAIASVSWLKLVSLLKNKKKQRMFAESNLSKCVKIGSNQKKSVMEAKKEMMDNLKVRIYRLSDNYYLQSHLNKFSLFFLVEYFESTKSKLYLFGFVQI